MPIRAKLGKPTGGQAPFGYVWKDRKLIPDPKEVPVRKLIYEMFLEHRRKKAVARLLDEAGYRTRNGSRFSDTTVDRLIRDPTAKGLHRANYTKSLGDKKHWRLKSQTDWVVSEVEPIVSAELWEQCNQILNDQHNGRRSASKTVNLFAGFAYCHCGQKMYVPSSNPKYICYKCHNKIPIADLETVFHEQLKDFFFSPTEILKYLEQADATIKEKQTLLDSLEGERQKTAGDMEKVFRLYMSDQLTPEGFGRQNRPLEERLKQLDAEIPKLQGEIDFFKIQYLSKDQIFSEARDIYDRWPSLPLEERRKIVENITEKVIIGKDDVTIELCYLPSPSEIASKGQRIPRGSSRRRA